MFSNNRAFSTLFVLTIVVRSGFTLEKCYECNSQHHACADPFVKENDNENKHLNYPYGITPVKCEKPSSSMEDLFDISYEEIDPPKPTGCFKMELRGPNNETTYYRGCIFGDNSGLCGKAEKRHKDKFVLCKICERDSCNGARTFTVWTSTATFIIMFIAIRIF